MAMAIAFEVSAWQRAHMSTPLAQYAETINESPTETLADGTSQTFPQRQSTFQNPDATSP
jgi:hypothetical protein